jgi:hypothetical protein
MILPKPILIQGDQQPKNGIYRCAKLVTSHHQARNSTDSPTEDAGSFRPVFKNVPSVTTAASTSLPTERHRSQWPRDLWRRSGAARLLRMWVRIPPGPWTFVCCECRVCCQVEVSATNWSLVRRSPTDCGASLCVWSRNLVNGPRGLSRQKQTEPTER